MVSLLLWLGALLALCTKAFKGSTQ